jgi:hypothetical protein
MIEFDFPFVILSLSVVISRRAVRATTNEKPKMTNGKSAALRLLPEPLIPDTQPGWFATGSYTWEKHDRCERG